MCAARNACRPASGFMRSKRQSTMARRGSPCSSPREATPMRVRYSMSPKLSAPPREPHPLQSEPATIGTMALTLYWGSGSPFAWRVLLALEHKRLPYESQLLHFDKQEHQSPQMLKLNPRGRVPVLKDGDYVVFESVAVLYYLDVKYPQAPIFGTNPEEAGVIMRVICEFMTYAEPSLLKITSAIFTDQVADDIDELTDAMHVVAREARTIEGRLSKEQWIVGADYSATDMVIFPWIQVLRRALDRPAAASLSARFLPMERNYPALARWIRRIEALPGYERTYPPHWLV